ncbi:hypothetical protein B0H14DRAFT_2704032 [Mycena olivaceomarginata]|nr:hypothetical protein B0H14DRAFT_2704032 [Mycena olivaceomarginata]
MLIVSVIASGPPLCDRQESTFVVPLTSALHRLKPLSQTLRVDVSAQDDSQSLINLEMCAHISEPPLFPDRNARLRYETLKMMASGYVSNLRRLEEHWRTVFTELFRAVLPGHVIMQEEGTLWTFHDTTQNPAATLTAFDRTIALSSGSGYSMRPDFRAIVSRNGQIHFPILGETKKAVSRQHVAPSGWPATSHGRTTYISSLRRAINQVELQAVVLFKLDHDLQDKAARQSTVCLVATVGPIYVIAIVTRVLIEAAYPDADLEEVDEQIGRLEFEEELDRARDVPALDPAQAESTEFREEEYTYSSKLPSHIWSRPCMLDTTDSDTLLKTIRGSPNFAI